MNHRQPGIRPADAHPGDPCAGIVWRGGARIARRRQAIACAGDARAGGVRPGGRWADETPPDERRAGELRWCGDADAGAAQPTIDLGRQQAGSATVLALAFAVLLLLAGLVAVDVGLLVVARARAQAAADLAALASLTPPGAGARMAGVVAVGNGAELAACACGAGEAVVTVRTRVRMLPGRMVVSVSARARAVLPAFSPTGQARSRRDRWGPPSGRAGGDPWEAARPGRSGSGPNERDPGGSRSSCGLVVSGWDRDGPAEWRWMRGKRHLGGTWGGARCLPSSMHLRQVLLNPVPGCSSRLVHAFLSGR